MRRKKRRQQSEVELNLAAMLDMAFQLLTFFILTFRPAPVEGQILLRLPPAQAAVASKGQQVGSNQENRNPVEGVNTLTITIFADRNTGEITSLGVGESQVAGLAALEGRLQQVFADPGNPFDQVIIQATDSCRYDELMKVIDICTRLTLPNGQHLSKLSFVGLPTGG